MIPWPLYFAPVVLIAELTQLVVAERHIGVTAIRAERDPRREPAPSAAVGWLWFAVAALGISYPGFLVFFGETRLQALTMMLFTVGGFEARRRGGLRWALVALTIEGAVRIGLICQMLGLWWMYGSPRLPGLGRYWD